LTRYSMIPEKSGTIESNVKQFCFEVTHTNKVKRQQNIRKM